MNIQEKKPIQIIFFALLIESIDNFAARIPTQR